MSNMKCPFCQQELEQITTSNPLGLGRIEMAICKKCMDKGVLHIMPIWDWQELIRTRKALDVAKERLKNTILDAEVLATPEYLASRAKETLAEITTLEQKD